jgi:hypothetical protein
MAGRGRDLSKPPGVAVKIPIQVEKTADPAPAVEYRWDPDTEILSAQLTPRRSGQGMSGSVELEGSDGSWLILDIADGCINGVEVAVWPEVQMRSSLALPGTIEDAGVSVPARRSQPGVAALEVETAMRAEADADERMFHFALGKSRATRAIRCARDLILEVDSTGSLAGLWLLNVPPFPARV